jgi:hypothetical protein
MDDYADRVRANTADHINRRIDEKIQNNVRYYSDRTKAEVTCRIAELDQEWDIERFLQLGAASLSLTGLGLGAVKNRAWFLLPMAVLSFLFLHATQGWCPPIPVLRRLGVRTRAEIERERYALKALLGDFENVAGSPDKAASALASVTH